MTATFGDFLRPGGEYIAAAFGDFLRPGGEYIAAAVSIRDELPAEATFGVIGHPDRAAPGRAEPAACHEHAGGCGHRR